MYSMLRRLLIVYLDPLRQARLAAMPFTCEAARFVPARPRSAKQAAVQVIRAAAFAPRASLGSTPIT